VVLDRAIAERGRFPAVNVLKSVSRTMPDCNTDPQNALVSRAKRLMSTYDDMAELIRLGAYRRGTDPEVDEAIHYQPGLEAFLSQSKDDHTDLESCYAQLAQILNMTYGAAADPQGQNPAPNPAPNQVPPQPGQPQPGQPQPGQTQPGQAQPPLQGRPQPQAPGQDPNAATPGLAPGLMPDMPAPMAAPGAPGRDPQI
jgi:flagellum-specific ATP synthase